MGALGWWNMCSTTITCCVAIAIATQPERVARPLQVLNGLVHANLDQEHSPVQISRHRSWEGGGKRCNGAQVGETEEMEWGICESGLEKVDWLQQCPPNLDLIILYGSTLV